MSYILFPFVFFTMSSRVQAEICNACLGLVQSQLFYICVGLSVDLTFLQYPSFPSFNKNPYSSIPCAFIEITFPLMTVMLKQ